MARVSDILDSVEPVFEDTLEDSLTVHNYIDAGTADGTTDPDDTDGWGDPTGGTDQGGTQDEHPDSPQTVSGSIDLRGRPSVDAAFSGIDVEADALGFIDSDAHLTSGGGTWNGYDVPYPSEVTDQNGIVWVAVHVFGTDSGRTRTLLRSESNTGDTA